MTFPKTTLLRQMAEGFMIGFIGEDLSFMIIRRGELGENLPPNLTRRVKKEPRMRKRKENPEHTKSTAWGARGRGAREEN